MSRRPNTSAVLFERAALPNWRIHRERQQMREAFERRERQRLGLPSRCHRKGHGRLVRPGAAMARCGNSWTASPRRAKCTVHGSRTITTTDALI